MAEQVWVVIPSATAEGARRADAAWAAMGYCRLLLCGEPVQFPPDERRRSSVQTDYWRGYPMEVNAMLLEVPGPVAVAAGDDMLPDQRFRADEIAAEYCRRFPGLDGIMQPTGDDWTDSLGRVCERICGSPWIGRRWIEDANLSFGAFWPGYYHFFADQEMHDVAIREGRLWQEPFLCQRHDHWHRTGGPRPAYMEAKERRWDQDRGLFLSRQGKGFPDAGLDCA